MEASVLRQLYDEFAPEYERTRVPRFRPIVKRLLQFYDTRPGSLVLDAGCGTGLAATMVAPRAGHTGKVLGVDASTRMLAIARQKAQGYGFDQCEFVEGDIAHLDVPDNSQDVVICSFALWGEPHALFAEFFRVLKPRGALLLQNWETERGGIARTYVETLGAFVIETPDERIRQVRGVLSKHREDWSGIVLPTDYERAMLQTGFGSASAQWFVTSTHFPNLDELVEFHDLGVWARAELAGLDDMTRASFHAALQVALQPLANERGVDEESRAIQVIARK